MSPKAMCVRISWRKTNTELLRPCLHLLTPNLWLGPAQLHGLSVLPARNLMHKTHTQNTTNKKILLEYKIGENQGDLGFDNDFVDTVPKAQSMKEKKTMINWNFIKIKNF